MSWKKDGVSIEWSEVLKVDLPAFGRQLAVVIFGPDSGLKAKTYERFRRKLNGPMAFDRKDIDGYVGQVKTCLSGAEPRPVLVCMHGDDSASYASRSRLVERLRRLGARKVVGIYVEANKGDHINYQAMDMEESFDFPAYLRQIERLNAAPPKSDEFDYYIVIDSREDE